MDFSRIFPNGFCPFFPFFLEAILLLLLNAGLMCSVNVFSYRGDCHQPRLSRMVLSEWRCTREKREEKKGRAGNGNSRSCVAVFIKSCPPYTYYSLIPLKPVRWRKVGWEKNYGTAEMGKKSQSRTRDEFDGPVGGCSSRFDSAKTSICPPVVNIWKTKNGTFNGDSLTRDAKVWTHTREDTPKQGSRSMAKRG